MRLVYEECWCESDDEARGWVALLGEDSDGVEPSCVGIFFPTCAWIEFGYRPVAGEAYT